MRLRLGRPWCEAIELRDSRQLILRPMRSSDGPTLRRSFRKLTAEEIRMRFMHPIKELTPDYAERLARIDRQREFALVLVENRHPDEALIGAVARAAIDSSGRHAEFALIVGREIGRQGLGRFLLGKVIEWARKKGLESLYGRVLNSNQPMLKLAQSLDFRIENGDSNEDDGVLYVRRRLK
ncbi:MAG: GNAT family N-acetyltransferase [Wenzhouxiangella sp.]|jgi:RimJ/RimL family protein N-acetyltransferase|nr:GNAT family N-acetyltransferase [Wenzhouxiangella sp.]